MWRRGWNDTKAGWLDWRFLLLDVGGSPILGVLLEPLTGVIAGLGGLVFVWIGATAKAPVRQRNEARVVAQSQTTGLFSSEIVTEALSQLSLERRIGVGIRNMGWDNTPLEKEEEWWQRVQQWLDTVCARMDSIHPADCNNWRVLGDVHMRNFSGVGVGRPDMERKLSMVTQWCDKLEAYINARTRQ